MTYKELADDVQAVHFGTMSIELFNAKHENRAVAMGPLEKVLFCVEEGYVELPASASERIRYKPEKLSNLTPE